MGGTHCLVYTTQVDSLSLTPPTQPLQVIWTQHLSTDYALFVALAIIDMQKGVLQNPKFEFSDIIEVCSVSTVYIV